MGLDYSSYLSYKPEAQSGLECWKQLRSYQRAFEQFKVQQKSPQNVGLQWLSNTGYLQRCARETVGKRAF